MLADEEAAAFHGALPDAVQRLSDADPVLAGLIERVGACTLAPEWGRSPFESLVRAVAHQQLQGKAAQAILGRFLALFAAPFPAPADILARADDDLRAVGFSRAKVAAIRDIAVHAERGLVPDRAAALLLDDDALIERLVAIRGVGAWTVQMLLIFTLGRLDVLPADDFGVRTGIRKTYGLDAQPKRANVLDLGLRWQPYRSIASWYLWRAAAFGRERTAADTPTP